MNNIWHDIEPGKVNELNVIIEIPKNSRTKYELDKKTGLVKFDRVLYSPMHYPTNYGFVPQTLWEDNDPLDVLVIAHEPLVPGTLVVARPIGALEMNDGGEDDIKILATPVDDPRLSDMKKLSDVHPHLLEEIRHFFQTYKDLQKKEVKIGAWLDENETEKAVKRSFELYQQKYGK